MKPIRVLSYDDDDLAIQHHIVKFLSSTFSIELANNTEECLEKLRSKPFDVLLLDKNLGENSPNGIVLLPELRSEFPNLAIIILTRDDDFNEVTRAFSIGANDYVIKKPSSMISDLQIRIPESVRRMKKDRFFEIATHQTHRSSYALCGTSRYVFELKHAIENLKHSLDPILITGPPGTGKTTLAYDISRLPLDPIRPYVYVDLNRISKQDLLVYLFGNGKLKKGAFLLADQGDLILDGLESIPLSIQEKILQTLENRCVTPIGSGADHPVEVRAIFVSELHLPDSFHKKIHPGLLERMQENHIQLLPLAKRKPDVSQMAFEIVNDSQSDDLVIQKTALDFITTYSWPGNLTQLNHTLKLAIKIAGNEGSSELDLSCLTRANRSWSFPDAKSYQLIKVRLPQFIEDISKQNYHKCIEEADRLYLEGALMVCENDTLVAAEKLGLSRSTLYCKITNYKISLQGEPHIDLKKLRKSLLLEKRRRMRYEQSA